MSDGERERLKESAGFDAEALRERVEGDPGCADFPALAELERRTGRPELAQRTAERGLRVAPNRLAGRVALGLALLDQGELAAARRELAAVFESPAISTSRPSPAARRAKADLPVGEGSAYRTRTMARLLENQGDSGRAEKILEGLGTSGDPLDAEAGPVESDPEATGPGSEGAPSKDEIEATLERWLRHVHGSRP